CLTHPVLPAVGGSEDSAAPADDPAGAGVGEAHGGEVYPKPDPLLHPVLAAVGSAQDCAAHSDGPAGAGINEVNRVEVGIGPLPLDLEWQVIRLRDLQLTRGGRAPNRKQGKRE